MCVVGDAIRWGGVGWETAAREGPYVRERVTNVARGNDVALLSDFTSAGPDYGVVAVIDDMSFDIDLFWQHALTVEARMGHSRQWSGVEWSSLTHHPTADAVALVHMT